MPDVSNSVSAGDSWSQEDLDEAIRLMSEETSLVVTLARLAYEKAKPERDAAKASAIAEKASRNAGKANRKRQKEAAAELAQQWETDQ